MNTGAKKVFMLTETMNATKALRQEIPSPWNTATASSMPRYCRNTGVPFEKMTIAALMPMPRIPHAGQYAESPAGIYSRRDAQAYHFPKGREDGKLDEAHHHAVLRIERMVKAEYRLTYKKG